MPYPTKKSQLEEAHRQLAKASYLLPEEGTFEQGYIALQMARAIIADLVGDVDSARSARLTIENLEILMKSHKNLTVAEVIQHADSAQG